MKSDRLPEQGNNSQASAQSRGSAYNTALRRMAEELGRIIGKFLAEGLRARPSEGSNKHPGSSEKGKRSR